MRRSKDAMVRAREGRDGTERVRSLGGKREESRDKREERHTSTTMISRSTSGMAQREIGSLEGTKIVRSKGEEIKNRVDDSTQGIEDKHDHEK